MSFRLKRFLIGRPLSNHVFGHQRLDNFSALAVFASDALSSVAYATEEILLVLVLVGHAGTAALFPISVFITFLLLVVMLSYRQTIHAYPSGGGAYTVARENLGERAGLVAGAALLIDYVLTVSVSISAGVSAITSAIPFLREHQVMLGIFAIFIVTIINLRGVKESGSIFAPPTFAFMFFIFLIIAKGLFNLATGGIAEHIEPQTVSDISIQGLSWFIILRAFSSGCTALTGIEAISNGVTAFRAPESKNASMVLLWLAIILSLMFLGISFLGWNLHIVPSETETVLSQLARSVFGHGWIYYMIQAATCSILILAANTSFNGFPRLCSLMAQDLYLPRQLQNLGDRLVFSNAILLLAFFSSLLVVLFNANTHHLIPLYAVGVFLSFTLSQFGMVKKQYTDRLGEWKKHLTISFVGGSFTAVVLLVIVTMKFTHGAWIICIVVPLLVKFFYSINQHYFSVQKDLQLTERFTFKKVRHKVIIPVSNIHKGVLESLIYAKSLSADVEAVSIVKDAKEAERLQDRWNSIVPDIPLTIIQNSYRSLLVPMLNHIKTAQQEDPDDMITVLIPSFVPVKWWHNLLHNQSSTLLRLALRTMKNVVVTSVHVHLSK